MQPFNLKALLIIVTLSATFGTLVTMAPNPEDSVPSQKIIIKKLIAAIGTDDMLLIRSLLFISLDHNYRNAIKIIVDNTGYADTRLSILTWIPDSDMLFADKIDRWLKLLDEFAPLPDPVE
jgi:hypothetical protein